MSCREAEAYAQQGQFAPGSMLPKVKASMKFAASKAERKAVICSLEKAALALSGTSREMTIYRVLICPYGKIRKDIFSLPPRGTDARALAFFEKTCPNLTKGLLSSAGLTKIDGNTAKGAFTMDQDKINILRIFQLDGTPVSCEDYGSGHVNVTFLVVTDTGRRYILQKINHHAFRNVQALSENIAAVTDFLRSKSSDPRSVMSLIRTKDGAYTIMWTGRSAFSSRRRTRISIRPPSVSVRLRSCSPTSRQKSCTRPSRIR